MENSTDIIKAEQLDTDNSIRLKTKNNELALLVKIKDTDADFALFIMEDDGDTIKKAYRISNCYPYIDTTDLGKEEISKELIFEFKASSPNICRKIPDEVIRNKMTDIKEMSLKKIFDKVYLYNGTETSDCNSQYNIDETNYILTDGQISMTNVRNIENSETRYAVDIMFSTYIIIVELDNTDINKLSLLLYANKDDLDISYDKIIQDVEKIKSSYKQMWRYFFKYLRKGDYKNE